MIKRALTVAGADSGGGAGIEADLKTFTVLKVYGMTAITAVTAQNTIGIMGVMEVSPEMVYLQIKAVCEDIGVDAVKTGMLPNSEIVLVVSEALREFNIKNLIVDPIIISSSGYPLIKEDAVGMLINEIFPISLIVTPNIPEAERLTGININSVEDMEKAAMEIKEAGSKYVLIKGGHLGNGNVTDVLYDGKEFVHLRGRYFKDKNVHGTGCTLSAAITAYIAKGESVVDAVRKARQYIEGAIEKSFKIGKGNASPNHIWALPN